MKRTRAIIVILILSLVLAGCGVIRKPNQAQAVDLAALKPIGVPSLEEKKAVFDRVWGLYDTYYPSFQLKMVNWQKEKEKYEPLALQASTWPKFFQIVNDMILTLHDPHCHLVGAPLPPIYYPFMYIRVVGNKLVVAAAPQTPQLKPGMVIMGLNGESLTDRLEEGYGAVFFKPDWFCSLQFQIPELFIEDAPLSENITVLDPHSGDIKHVLVHVYRFSKLQDLWDQYIHAHHIDNPYTPFYSEAELLPFYLQDNQFTINYIISYLKTKAVRIREMSDGILYIGISRMSFNLVNQLQPYMPQILKAKGIIIDVRDNPGGDACTWFAEHFYGKGMVPVEYRVVSNHHLGPWIRQFLVPLTPHISAPTAVLINGTSVSAAELFAAQMEVAPNVRTFGSRTAGVCEATAVRKVMNGVSVWVAQTQLWVAATGLPIEGVGIAPEVSVHETYPEFMRELHLVMNNQNPDSADAVLQAAKKWVLSQMSE